MMNRAALFVLGILCTYCGSGDLAAQEAAAEQATPEYEAVGAILTKYCAGCHNDADSEADFSVESFASLQKGTANGPAVLPGQAESSRIVRVLTGAAEPQMPPEGEARPSAEEVALLRAWIDAGAKGPAGAEPDRMTLIVPEIEPETDTRPIAAVDVSPDAALLAVARYSDVTLLPLNERGAIAGEGRSLGEFPGKVTAVHFARGGSRLVTASGVVGTGGVAALWNVEDGELIREFRGHRDLLYDAEISPDGAVLATCSYDAQIILWDVESGAPLRTLSGHNGAVYDVAFSPDARFLVSASADDTCKVWRVSDGERMDTLGQPLKEQYACAFSPDGRMIVAGGADNRIRVWRFVSRNRVRINPLLHARFAHEGAVLQLAFTPDGRRLVSVAENRTLKVWETRGYTELHLEHLDEVSMALAVGGSDRASDRAAGAAEDAAADAASIDSRADSARDSADFASTPVMAVGLMDGTLLARAVPQGRPSRATDGPQTISQATRIATGKTSKAAEAAEQEPNNHPGNATPLAVPVNVTGVVNSGDETKNGETGEAPDIDLFRFSAKAGEEWVVEVNAARSKSPLDSHVEVLDADGDPIERVLLQAVRDSYFTFRGKNADQSNDFRVFNWEEMELNEYLYASGEVVKLWLYPRGPDSGFNVYPGTGNRWGYFDTTPLAHALGEPCYIVRPFPPGSELVPNGLPVFTLHYENDDDSRRELGRDSRVFFTAPADGEYLVRLRDVRGYEGADFTYTLTIRPRRPDFRVRVHNRNPTVAPGSAKEFKITAERIDRFDGPIEVEVDGLPPGFSVTSPLVIEEGQISAFGVITADPDAPAPTEENAKSSQVRARATIRGKVVTHTAGSLGEFKLGETPKLQVAVQPAEGGAEPLPASSGDRWEFEIHPGETIMLKVVATRHDEDGEISFGKEDAGPNLPHGVYVDNIGLNGLLLLEDQSEREFFITAADWVPAQTRTFHLTTRSAGGHSSPPVVLHVRPAAEVAGR